MKGKKYMSVMCGGCAMSLILTGILSVGIVAIRLIITKFK